MVMVAVHHTMVWRGESMEFVMVGLQEAQVVLKVIHTLSLALPVIKVACLPFTLFRIL